jgi:hypothetical protein
MQKNKEIWDSIRACVRNIINEAIWGHVEARVTAYACCPGAAMISDNVWMPVEANWNDYVFLLIYKRTYEYSKK